jgi:hypothetical protein
VGVLCRYTAGATQLHEALILVQAFQLICGPAGFVLSIPRGCRGCCPIFCCMSFGTLLPCLSCPHLAHVLYMAFTVMIYACVRKCLDDNTESTSITWLKHNAESTSTVLCLQPVCAVRLSPRCRMLHEAQHRVNMHCAVFVACVCSAFESTMQDAA